MSEQKILTPVAPLVLAGEEYLLAKNGGYSLHRPKAPDAFGVVAHEHVPILPEPGDGVEEYGLSLQEQNSLVQLLGTYIEENERLKKAVGKGAG